MPSFQAPRHRRRHSAAHAGPVPFAVNAANRGANPPLSDSSLVLPGRACNAETSGYRPGPRGSLARSAGRCLETAQGILARPLRTNFASSGLWSAKNRKGLDAANSWPWNSIGVPGPRRSRAVIARYSPGLVNSWHRTPPSRIRDLVVVLDIRHEGRGRNAKRRDCRAASFAIGTTGLGSDSRISRRK